MTEADREYRAALGLPPGGPLPKTLGTVSTGASPSRRRQAAKNGNKTSRPPR